MYVDDDMLDQLTDDNNWSFTLKDLDLDKLEKETILLVDQIWNDGKGSRINGRSKEQIYDDTYRGLAAEHYLIEHQGFTNNPEHCQDVLDPDGNRIEVKVTVSEKTMKISNLLKQFFKISFSHIVKLWYKFTYPKYFIIDMRFFMIRHDNTPLRTQSDVHINAANRHSSKSGLSNIHHWYLFLSHQ